MTETLHAEMYRELTQGLMPDNNPQTLVSDYNPQIPAPDDEPDAEADPEIESAFSDAPIKKQRPQRRIRAGEVKTDPDTPPYVFVTRTDVVATGDGNAAILHARIAYWHSISMAGKQRLVSPDPCGEAEVFWTPGYERILEETGMGRDKARRALRSLMKKRLIDVTPGSEHDTYFRNGARDRRLHITFTTRHHQALLKRGRLGCSNSIPGVCVQVANVRITETGTQAIVLSSIQPWFEPNQQGKSKLRISRNGFKWRANSYDQLAAETGLSKHQVKRAVHGLRKAGYLIADHFLFCGKRVLHVRLDADAMRSAWARQQQESELPEQGGD